MVVTVVCQLSKSHLNLKFVMLIYSVQHTCISCSILRYISSDLLQHNFIYTQPLSTTTLVTAGHHKNSIIKMLV